jgi:hypothetical protein
MNKKRLAMFIALVFVLLISAVIFMGMMYGPNGASNVTLTQPMMTTRSTDSYGLGTTSMVSERMMPPSVGITAQDNDLPVTDVNPEDRKVVKSGIISIVVKDVDGSTKQLSDKAIALGGYTSSTNFYNSGTNESKSGYIRFRIPVAKVDEFVSVVKSNALRVQSENINSKDVTAQFIDLQARIKNLESSETQLQDLMTRAGKVSDVLEVQRELTSTRTQIEQLKGQLKYLEGSSELSDITVNIALDASQLPIPPEAKWQPGTVLKLALRELINVATNLSYLVIYIAVFAVIWVPVGLGLKWLYKFLKRKMM